MVRKQEGTPGHDKIPEVIQALAGDTWSSSTRTSPSAPSFSVCKVATSPCNFPSTLRASSSIIFRLWLSLLFSASSFRSSCNVSLAFCCALARRFCRSSTCKAKLENSGCSTRTTQPLRCSICGSHTFVCCISRALARLVDDMWALICAISDRVRAKCRSRFALSCSKFANLLSSC